MKLMKAVLILSFQKEANVRAVALVTNGIHGIQKMIGSVPKELQRTLMSITNDLKAQVTGKLTDEIKQDGGSL